MSGCQKTLRAEVDSLPSGGVVIGQNQGFCRHEQDGLDFYRSFGVGSRRSIAFPRDGVAVSARHFGVWVRMQYGVAFGWASAPQAARLNVAAMQGPALLIGSLLFGSAVFIYWELARSEVPQRLAVLSQESNRGQETQQVSDALGGVRREKGRE